MILGGKADESMPAGQSDIKKYPRSQGFFLETGD